MRIHGTLTKWNDDRGFGFITPAKSGPDLFVHISAFPRHVGRPQLNELISFEVEAGADGKQRAIRVMRAGQRLSGPTGTVRKRHGSLDRLLGRVFTVLAVTAICAFGYSQYTKQVVPKQSPISDVSLPPASSSSSCDGRTMCSQMTSCAEATYFIRNCPNTKMDGDGDGVPCESQWCT
jgi:cold shock CspA family protein